jgi:hypothetical protein
VGGGGEKEREKERESATVILSALQTHCADVYERMLLFLPVDLEDLHARLNACNAGRAGAAAETEADRAATSKSSASSAGRGKVGAMVTSGKVVARVGLKSQDAAWNIALLRLATK